MADRAISEDALIAGLRDIRLPAEASGGLVAELLVALALGLILAAVLGLVLRGLTLARPPRVDKPPRLEDLPEEAQKLALLRQLKERAPERYATLRAALYRAGGLPDLAELREEVRRHV